MGNPNTGKPPFCSQKLTDAPADTKTGFWKAALVGLGRGRRKRRQEECQHYKLSIHGFHTGFYSLLGFGNRVKL